MRWVLILLLLPGCVEPEATPVGEIHGAFVDQMLCPYGYQDVQLPAFSINDTTSELGGFLFRNVPHGRYEVTSYVAGVGMASEWVTLDGEDAKLFLILHRDESPCVIESNHTTRHTQVLEGFGEFILPGQECPTCGWELDMLDVHTALIHVSWLGDPTHLELVAMQGDDEVRWLGTNPTSRLLTVRPEPLQLHVILPEDQLPAVNLHVQTRLSLDVHNDA